MDDTAEGLLAYVGGEYRILVRETLWYMGATSGFACEDGIIEVQARFASAVSGLYGLIFGITDDWDHYLFAVSNNQRYSLLKATGGDWVFLVPWTTSSHLNAGQAINHLRVERNGAQIKLYANGHYLTSANDSSYSGILRVGLAAISGDFANVDARFDNFRVWPLGAFGGAATPARFSRRLETNGWQ